MTAGNCRCWNVFIFVTVLLIFVTILLGSLFIRPPFGATEIASADMCISDAVSCDSRSI